MAIAQRKITVVGAGYVGMTCAQLCAAEGAGRARSCLIDVLEGRPQGIALDLNQAAAVEGFGARVVGTNDPARDRAARTSFIVTAGLPRKPGMSRSDLLEVNGKIDRRRWRDYVRDGLARRDRDRRHEPARRDGAPDARASSASRRGAWSAWPACSTRRASRGSSPRRPAPRSRTSTRWCSARTATRWCRCRKACTVNGVPLGELVDGERSTRMAERTRNGGGEIVNLLKTGSAFYAPAAASVAMAASILNDEQRLLPCACFLNGQYGFEGLVHGRARGARRAGRRAHRRAAARHARRASRCRRRSARSRRDLERAAASLRPVAEGA